MPFHEPFWSKADSRARPSKGDFRTVFMEGRACESGISVDEMNSSHRPKGRGGQRIDRSVVTQKG